MAKIAYIATKESSRVNREVELLSTNNDTNDEYDIFYYQNLLINIRGRNVDVIDLSTKKSLLEYDVVFHRTPKEEDMRTAVATIFAENGKVSLNQDNIATQNISKLQQGIRFAYSGVSAFDTIVLRGDRITTELLRQYMDAPCVIKNIRGRNGGDNYLVESLTEIPELEANDYYAVQSYVDNDGDYRIIVGDDDIILAYKRVRHDSSTHLNNITTGAKREYIEELDPDVRELAIRAARSLNRGLAGVDVLVGFDGVSRVLEVNFSYGVPQFEEAIERRYIENLAQYFRSKLDSNNRA